MELPPNPLGGFFSHQHHQRFGLERMVVDLQKALDGSYRE
jgi:hypothetical protein